MKQANLFKKASALLMTAVIAASCMTTAAFADDGDSAAQTKLPSLWADGNPNIDSADENAIDVVRWFAYNDRSKEVNIVGNSEANHYFLLLPSTADLNALTIWHNFPENPKINGIEVKSGEKCAAIADEDDYKMNISGKEVTLTVMKSSSIGSMYISTETGTMKNVHNDKSIKESGNILVVESDGTQDYSGALSYIKGRGNTTWGMQKKPYNIKLDKKASLFGMDESKKWCLLANGQDHSMMRNKIAYDLADELGLEFTPDSQYADLYLNGEYVGVYQLTEKVEEGKNNLVKINDLTGATEKVNDAELETYKHVDGGTDAGSLKYFEIPNDPEDITGGYLLELDVSHKYIEESSGFVTSRKQSVSLKGPEIASKAQIEYISSFYQDMEDAIYSKTGFNDKGKHFSEYIDTESAALMYLIHEFSLNIDGGTSSCFFYKESDSKGDGLIHAGPAWDFDVAFGNLDNQISWDSDMKLNSTDAIYIENHLNWEMADTAFFGKLCTHQFFNAAVKKAYNEKFKPALDILNSSEKISGTHLSSIAKYRSDLETAAAMNYTRWNIKDKLLVSAAGKTFDSQMNYLTDFISGRTAFFESYFNKPASDSFTVYYADASGISDGEISSSRQIFVCIDDPTGGNSNSIEMKPLDKPGLEYIYKADLKSAGFTDDGTVTAYFTDGGELNTKKTKIYDNILTAEVSDIYYDIDDNKYEYNAMQNTTFNEKNIVDSSYMIGDIDGDFVITANDAVKILRFSVEQEFPQSRMEWFCSLVDDDNSTTSADALYVLRISVGMSDSNIVNSAGKQAGVKIELFDYDYYANNNP